METMPPLLFVSVSAENYEFQMATPVNHAFLCLNYAFFFWISVFRVLILREFMEFCCPLDSEFWSAMAVSNYALVYLNCAFSF
jgi:hypothetical protein